LFEVTKRARDSNPRNKYGRGDAFGEQYLLLKAQRSMKVECVQRGTVWKINRQTFRSARHLLLCHFITYSSLNTYFSPVCCCVGTFERQVPCTIQNLYLMF
jgi:CRP-like cAMP-binding protein